MKWTKRTCKLIIDIINKLLCNRERSSIASVMSGRGLSQKADQADTGEGGVCFNTVRVRVVKA